MRLPGSRSGVGGVGTGVVVRGPTKLYFFNLGFYFIRAVEPFKALKWDAGMRRE